MQYIFKENTEQHAYKGEETKCRIIVIQKYLPNVRFQLTDFSNTSTATARTSDARTKH